MDSFGDRKDLPENQVGKNSSRILRNVLYGVATIAVIGSAGSIAWHKYDKNNAVKQNVAPLAAAKDSLEKKATSLETENAQLERATVDLGKKVTSLTDTVKAVTHQRDDYAKLAQRTERKAKVIADSMKGVTDSVKIALLESYPSEIRNNDYRYTQTEQNGRIVAQLEIVSSVTEKGEELHDRYEIWKGFNDLYPGLLNQVTRGRNTPARKVRVVEKDNQVFDVRPTYEGQAKSDTTFTYKHLSLINNGNQRRK